jgi:AcrR family transcriptional regulator
VSESYDGVVVGPKSTLGEDKLRVTVERILSGARRVLGERGFAITVDEIAEAAGVSRRTVFRHFPNRDDLLVAAIEHGMKAYPERVPAYEGGDWEGWWQAVCERVHRTSSTYGPGYWELTVRQDLAPALLAVEQRRRRARQRLMRDLAGELWAAIGVDAPPPPTVVATVAAALSPHLTAAVVEGGGTWQDAARWAMEAVGRVIADEAAATRRPAS